MSTAITEAPKPIQKASALALLASRLSVEPEKMLGTLKATVCAKATNEEIMAFCIVANEYGLNPFLKELYAFPAKGGGIVPVVSIDGWVRIINEHPQMNGITFDFVHADGGKLVSCTCRIFRKDRSHPIEVTEFLSECYRATDPWKMESRMLRHKALIQCARYAFGFSGIHDEDEASEMRNATGRVVTTPQRPVENPFKPALPEPAKPFDDLPSAKPADGFVDQPDSDPVPAHVSPDSINVWLSRIEDDCLQADTTLSAFQDACRKSGAIGASALLEKQSVSRLASLHANLLGIIAKANGGGEE